MTRLVLRLFCTLEWSLHFLCRRSRYHVERIGFCCILSGQKSCKCHPYRLYLLEDAYLHAYSIYIQDIQKRARQEALSILGDGSGVIMPTMEQTKSMKYINCIIKEVRVKKKEGYLIDILIWISSFLSSSRLCEWIHPSEAVFLE